MDERIIRAKLEGIRRRSVRASWPIRDWEYRLADHLSPGEYAYDGDWQRLSPVDSLWDAGKTLFLRSPDLAPEAPPLDELFLAFRTEGMEGLLSLDGRPYAGIDANHQRVHVPHRGQLGIEVEFMVLLQSLCEPELREEKGRFRGAEFRWVDLEIEAAYYDLLLAWEAAKSAPDVRRRELLHAALEEALLIVDLTADDETFRGQTAAARARLSDRIDAIGADPEAGSIYLTGHSHIDTAWLWPLRETVRKCSRTFATACRLMERYPEFRFSCSQPQLYAYTKRYYPELYQDIRKWVATGRWETTGAMWVEMDCNVPSGEAMVRQMLHGLRFFREEFGTRPRNCWLPDVFGYPASMPQILTGCGLDSFYTTKLHWQAKNPFPHHLFWWEGIDGTRILAHVPDLLRNYNGWPNPDELRIAWDRYADKGRYPELLMPIGFGDGGGGVTEAMLEYVSRSSDYPGMPHTRQGCAEDYYRDVMAAEPDLARWVGELYLETHRGTYTTQSESKRGNRKNELLLRDAELLGLLANDAAPDSVDMAPLDAAWENVLLLQFHDILPGSSIGEVYRELAEDNARIAATVGGTRESALDVVTQSAGEGQLAVVNTLSWPRSDLLTLKLPTDSGALELVDQDQRAWPVQKTADGARAVAWVDGVPSMGYRSYAIRAATTAPASSLSVVGRRLENRFFVIELDDVGQLTRLYDKQHDREVLAPGEPANVLHLYQDGPEIEAAWNVHDTFDKREYAWDPGTTLEVVETGPVRAVVRVTKTYRDSRLTQDIVVYDRIPRIDFCTHVDWQARQVMLKVAFPVAVRSPRATYEIQYGAVERPTHHNTSWDEAKFEVCAHRWADLSEPGYGVSLMNDSRYGYDIYDHVMRLTLLRGAEWPDPDADRGAHEFTYSFYPHAGDWTQAETVRRAYELNAPLLARVGSGPAGELGEHAFFQVTGPAILDAVKPAEDGRGWILRLYEPHGARGRVTVHLPRAASKVWDCNLVEEDGDEMAVDGDGVPFDMRPFQVRALRVLLS